MVSVIVPVYNAAKYVESCLRSVMGQTHRDLEIIVIDDGSTDNSYQICAHLAKNDERIILIHQENAGVSSARNKGLDVAQGEYIMFVDADDRLPTRGVELLLYDMQSTGAELTIGSHTEFRKGVKNKRIRETRLYHIGRIKKDVVLAEKVVQFLWGRLYNRNIITISGVKFKKDIPYGEDTIFNLEYCRYVQRVSTIDTVVYNYRLGGMASSVRYYPNKDELLLKLAKHYQNFAGNETNGVDINHDILVRNFIYDCICHYIINLPYKQAVRLINKTLGTFSSYLNEEYVTAKLYGKKLARYIMQKEVTAIYFWVYLNNFWVISKKKAKRIYHRFRKNGA